MADTSLFRAQEGLPLDLLVLMTDIIPTGFSVARNARTLLETDGVVGKDGVCVVIGCGPVGSESIASAGQRADCHRSDCAPFPLLALCLKRCSPQISPLTDWKPLSSTVPSPFRWTSSSCNLQRLSRVEVPMPSWRLSAMSLLC